MFPCGYFAQRSVRLADWGLSLHPKYQALVRLVALVGNARLPEGEVTLIAKTLERRLMHPDDLFTGRQDPVPLSEVASWWVDRIHRISDKLLDNREAIEAHLRRESRRLFEADRTIILHDLTSTYFEGQMELDGRHAGAGNRALVVLDAGVATTDNLVLLREAGFSYLVNDTRGRRSRYRREFRESGKFQRLRHRVDPPDQASILQGPEN